MFTATKDDNVRNLKSPGIQDNVTEAKENLREAANDAGRRVRGFLHTAGDEITHAKDTVTTQIRSNPIQSSVVALGLGFVLGALYRR